MARSISEMYDVEHISLDASNILLPFPVGESGIPGNWTSENMRIHRDEPYVLEKLPSRCWEYNCIEREFEQAGAKVIHVDRIENKELWEKFHTESQRMLRSRTDVNEVYLLHGTKGNQDDICHEGLDQRLSRIGHFGRGIYLSNDARKCFNYIKKDGIDEDDLTTEQQKCTVYKCRVLLGICKVYPKGQNDKNLKREPSLDKPGLGGPKYYDSVKGQISDYEEFVVYKSERVLPEYIITCLPPKMSSSGSSLSSQPVVANGQQVTHLATKTLSDSASPTNSLEQDDEALELKYFKDQQRHSLVTSVAGHSNIVGAVGRTREERSGSIGSESPPDETCESAEEEEFASAVEEVCESADEDTGESADEEMCDSTSENEKEDKHVSALPTNVPAKQTTQLQDETSSSSPAGTVDEDEFQKHLLEVRNRVQERRRNESANPTSIPLKVNQDFAQTKATLDSDHQKRLLEVRRRVRESRLKEGKTLSSKLDEVVGQVKTLTEPVSSKLDENSATDEDEVPEENVNKVMSSLLAQFLEFTGCDDVQVATRYIKHAQMDVNDAIMMYLNAEQ